MRVHAHILCFSTTEHWKRKQGDSSKGASHKELQLDNTSRVTTYTIFSLPTYFPLDQGLGSTSLCCPPIQHTNTNPACCVLLQASTASEMQTPTLIYTGFVASLLLPILNSFHCSAHLIRAIIHAAILGSAHRSFLTPNSIKLNSPKCWWFGCDIDHSQQTLKITQSLT